MRGPTTTRVALAAGGVGLGLFGAYSLVRLGLSNLGWSVAWLAGGVLVNDAVLAPLAIGMCALGARLLPGWARAPFVTGAILLGSLTLLAVPVLGRFGALPDNPTLLDRSYGFGWLVVAAVTAALVAGACLVARRRVGPTVGSSVSSDHG